MKMKRDKVFVATVFFVSCILLLTGCESLRRKFTRTKKKEESQEVVIITPRDYSAHPLPSDVLYKQYFNYWKSWNEELVTSLNDSLSHKKIVDCANQSLINLKKMATYLTDEKAKEIGVFIKKTADLKADMEANTAMLPAQMDGYKYTAERILSSVNRQFDLTRMRRYLK